MKTARHAKIIEIINKYNIETQEELADKLNEAGFQVTQATVSRDIRELKLMKISENGERQRYVLRDGFVSMDMAQNILVIKTASGMVMAVALALDELHWNEIVGCVAGDDTVMCAIRTVDDTLITMDKINKVLQ